jgi:hypothetical protein
MKKYLFIDTWNGEGYSESKAFVEEHANDIDAMQRCIELADENGSTGEYKGFFKTFVAEKNPSLMSISYTTPFDEGANYGEGSDDWDNAGMVSVEELKPNLVGVLLEPNINDYGLYYDKSEWKSEVLDEIVNGSEELTEDQDTSITGQCHHTDDRTMIALELEDIDGLKIDKNPDNYKLEEDGGDGVEYEVYTHIKHGYNVEIDIKTVRDWDSIRKV